MNPPSEPLTDPELQAMAEAVITAALAWYERQSSHTIDRLWSACRSYRIQQRRKPPQQPIDYESFP
jgi:hypothetical protein